MASLLFFCGMKNILIFVMLGVSLAGCAQMNKSIVKANAYFTIPTPGNIPVDDNGNPRQIQPIKVYNVFMELKGQTPEWTGAWINEKFYTLIPLPIKEQKAIIGKRKDNDQKIMMEAAAGNILLQFELAPNEALHKPPQTLKPNELLLAGKWKGKPFYYKISNIIELASPQYQ